MQTLHKNKAKVIRDPRSTSDHDCARLVVVRRVTHPTQTALCEERTAQHVDWSARSVTLTETLMLWCRQCVKSQRGPSTGHGFPCALRPSPTKLTSFMKRFQPHVITSFATHVASRPAQTSSDVPVQLEVSLLWTMATPAELLLPQCGWTRYSFMRCMVSPGILTIIVAVSFHLGANPIHQTVMQTHVVICVLSPPSLLLLVSNPPPLLPPSDSCKRAGRQDVQQEHNTHNFTFL